MERIAATDIFDKLNPGKRELTADERDHLEDLLDASLAWKNDEITGNVLLRMGMIEYQGPNGGAPHPSPPLTRWLALGLGIKNRSSGGMTDPRWVALREFLDRLVEFKYVVTPQGVMSREETRQHDAAIRLMQTSHKEAA